MGILAVGILTLSFIFVLLFVDIFLLNLFQSFNVIGGRCGAPGARVYLVDGRELRAHRAGGVQSAAVAEATRRPLPTAVQRSARRLLPLQRPGGRLVSPELGAALAVAVRRAGLAVQPVVAARPRAQPLGDVLAVGGRAALTGAPAEHRQSAAGGAAASNQSDAIGQFSSR